MFILSQSVSCCYDKIPVARKHIKKNAIILKLQEHGTRVGGFKQEKENIKYSSGNKVRAN